MKKKFVFGLILSAVLLIVSGVTYSQGMGGGGWGMNSKYGRMYNPKTVETVKGEVISIDRITPVKGMNYGVHMKVKLEKEDISVHVGPGWYIENQEMTFSSGDKVEIKGSKIIFDGKPAIIAAEITKGDDVLKLRDENGFPYWSGWRKSQMM